MFTSNLTAERALLRYRLACLGKGMFFTVAGVFAAIRCITLPALGETGAAWFIVALFTYRHARHWLDACENAVTERTRR